MKNILTSVIVLILIVLAVAVLAKNWVLKRTVQLAVTGVTGFETRIADLRYDFPSTLWIKGLKINNPKRHAFQQETFVNIPEIYASLSLGELLRGERIHLSELGLDLEDVNVEKTKEGVSNIGLLQSLAPGGEAREEKPKGAEKKTMPFLLDRLELTVRNVRYDDRSGIVPKTISKDLRIEKQVFENIQDPKSIVGMIALKIIYGARLSDLGLDPKKLEGALKTGLVSGGEVLLDTRAAVAGKAAETKEIMADKGGKTLQDTQATVGEGADAVKDKLDDAADAAKDKFSGFLGKVKSGVESATQ